MEDVYHVALIKQHARLEMLSSVQTPLEMKIIVELVATHVNKESSVKLAPVPSFFHVVQVKYLY